MEMAVAISYFMCNVLLSNSCRNVREIQVICFPCGFLVETMRWDTHCCDRRFRAAGHSHVPVGADRAPLVDSTLFQPSRWAPSYCPRGAMCGHPNALRAPDRRTDPTPG